MWLAIVKRLLSTLTGCHFVPIAELTDAERAEMLDSFLQRARNSSLDIATSLATPWDEIERWTDGFYWVGSKTGLPESRN